MLEKFYITCAEENHWTIDAPRADDKIIFLRDEYEKFWRKIQRGENFALTRQADGERALMTGQAFKVDGWSNSGGGINSLGEALLESLKIDAPNFFYGISCPCCDSAAYYWYLQNIKSSNVTFSNIWVNGNFKTFQKNFQKLERDAVLITNWRGKGKTYGRLNVKRHYFVSDDCVKFFEDGYENLIQQIIAETGHEKNLLYVVSAGPLSCVIIAELFKNNPDNCYVDFGSATDLMTHGNINRGYVIEGNPTSEKNCWMFDRKKINLDIDVVLTCYKRPQVLAQQLEAVKNQTLKPRRIFLYQDGIDGYYKVELNDKILSRFDACKISLTNGGVWKRFEFAEEICKSPYVCIFDDDTIPGARWLENCHMNMMQQRGIYVTNGVLVRNFKDYKEDRIWVGVYNPNFKTCAVDFGGHAWFFERQCLTWMLAVPWREKYKFVGEDMTISAAAKKHGVGTYTPQHPKKIFSIWGSLPEFAFKYGSSEVGVSANPSNSNKMQAALTEIHANGWKMLLEENPEYLNEFTSALESENFHYLEAFVSMISPPPQTQSVTVDLFQMLKDSVKNLSSFFGKRTPIFLGERKAFESVKELFDLRAEDYHVLENECDEIETEKLFETLRQGAIHIFFTDAYKELKPFLEQWGLREDVDFMDGRNLIIALIN